MKKRIIICVVAMLTAALILSGCSKTEKTYKIATEYLYPPFITNTASGALAGIDIEILHGAAAAQAIDYELIPMNFSDAAAKLESGEVDGVMAAVMITNQRQLEYDFSDPYFASGIVMVTGSGDTQIACYPDLRKKSVAVKKGTASATMADAMKTEFDFSIKYFASTSDELKSVTSGECAACFEEEAVVKWAINQGYKLRIAYGPENVSSYAFAVKKGQNKELLEQFNKGLAYLKSCGAYDDIVNKYTS